jgi:hypothetical protein
MNGEANLERTSNAAVFAGFGALVLLATAELLVPGLAAGRSLRITLLAGLLMAKIGIVFLAFLRVRANRRSTGLLAAALVMAAGFAVVLMIETWHRSGIR